VTPEHYQVAREYFHKTVDLTPEERDRELDTIASATVRDEVWRLLQLSDADTTFLDEPLFDVPQSLSPGDLVGRFRIIRSLARGGMGEVFEAEDLKFSQRYAIKTIAAEWLDDRETVSRFERETKIGRELNHPNVCRVYEYLEERRGRHILGMVVMELIDGRTLEEVVSAEGPLSLEHAGAVLSGILDGLEAAHNCGVIHRDLKPGNVMVQNSGRVVLMDFGLARHAGDSSRTQRIRGTASYMAPEQHRGESTFRSDIYSLGLLVHFLLTARQPEADRSLPRRWREAIRRCTLMVPSDRFASVAEVRRAFFPRRVWSRRSWITGVSATTVAGLIVLWETSHRSLDMAAGKPLVIEAVENRTGDPLLDALAPVILTQLEQSPRLRLVEASTRGLGLKVVLASDHGGIRLGFTLQSLEGGPSKTQTVRADSRADVFSAVYEGCRWVRRTLGESAQDMAELDLRPESATTGSWEALMAFTRAERDARDRKMDAALVALGEALRLDSNFALASMRKGDILSSLGRDGEAIEAWRETIQLAVEHRLTRLEEFRIRSMFAADTWDFANSIKIYNAYVGYYPHDQDAWHFRAIPLLMMARGPEAIETMEKSLAIEPRDAGTQAEMGLFGSIVGRPELAKEHLPLAATMTPALAARISQLVAFIEGRYGELGDWYDRAMWRNPPEQQSVVRTQHAHVLAELGHWTESEKVLRDGIALDQTLGLIGESNRKKMSLLTIKTRFKQQGRDLEIEQLVESIGAYTGPWVRVSAVSALARAGLMATARLVLEGLDLTFPTPMSDYAIHRARGEILMMEDRVAAGLTHLEKAAAALPPAWPREFLGWGLEKAGHSTSATSEYRRVAASKGIYWVSVYLERPGIWADTLERLVSLDPGSALSAGSLLREIRKKGEG